MPKALASAGAFHMSPLEKIKRIIADDKNYPVEGLKVGAIWEVCDASYSFRRGEAVDGSPFVEVKNKEPASPVQKERWFDGGVSIDAKGLRLALDFLGGDEDSEVTLKHLAAEQTEDKKAGIYVWCSEYPEEGSALVAADEDSKL